MRIVPAARPVSSATSLMLSNCPTGTVGVRPARGSGSSLSPARRVPITMIPSANPKRILLTGATGYVGGELLPVLLDAGHDVRCLVRDPSQARLPEAATLVRGDVRDADAVREALRDTDVSYYLVHSMGGKGGDFAAADRAAASAFGGAARDAGVGRLVYLGGLHGGPRTTSAHLRSREEVGRILAEHVPGTVHVRAAMVIGAQSASFLMMRSLVDRLPVMVCPRWIDTRTQPVAVRDVVATLAALAVADHPPAEVELVFADMLTYREMIPRHYTTLGRTP